MPKINAKVIGRHLDVTKKLIEKKPQPSESGKEGSSESVSISEEAKRKHIMGRVISGITGEAKPDEPEKP